jgi:uncharacterized surface protein with fasciclin (FAS1) repeats
MKKTIFLFFLLAYHIIVWAQTTATTDTAKKLPKLTRSSLLKTDGSLMLSTNDITTNISRSPELSGFYRIIDAAGLTETFKSKGPITVFAPDNGAFNNLSKGKIDTLLMTDRKYDLIALVTYHAIAGIVTSKDIAHAISDGKGTATFTTLTGNKLTARLDDNRNIVLTDEHGGQSILNKFDIQQSNGLLHITNAVLIPRFKDI